MTESLLEIKSPKPFDSNEVLFEYVRAKDVEAFSRLKTERAPWGRIVPISVSRARAWSRNPHAKSDDVVLIVARLNGHCAGYIGLVPGYLKGRERLEPMYWVSTFFVPEALRGYPIGYLLLRRAIGLGRMLAVVEPSDKAERLSLAMGYRALRPIEYFNLDFLRDCNLLGLPLRAVRRALPRANRPSPKWLDTAIAQCGLLTARMLIPLLLLSAKRGAPRWRMRIVERIPVEKSSLSADGTQFVRDRSLLDWMIRHPWVTTIRDTANSDYFFDDFREQFFHRIVEIRKGTDQTVGWAIVWFYVRDGRRDLHVLDYELDDADAPSAIVVLALREALRYGATRISIPGASQVAVERLGFLARLFTVKTRRCLCRPVAGSGANLVLEDISLHYADGDFGFA